MTRHKPHIVLVGGAMLPRSTTEMALRFTAQVLEELGAHVEIFAGAQIDLPMYAPENPSRTDIALRILKSLRKCDGIVIAGEGYHGALSGMIKNVLDYAEDLSKDASPYFHGRVVGLIGAASTWRDLGTVLISLRSVVHALRGWPTPLGVAINASLPTFGDNGHCLVPELASQLRMLAEQVLEFAGKRTLLQSAFADIKDADYLAWD